MTLNEAIKYAYERGHVGILEKNGKYETAKNWEEVKYAEECGWNYIGHPADLNK